MKKIIPLASLAIAIAVTAPTNSFARGEDAAINRNDSAVSSMTDRSNNRTYSWNSARNMNDNGMGWNSNIYREEAKRDAPRERYYDYDRSGINSDTTTYKTKKYKSGSSYNR